MVHMCFSCVIHQWQLHIFNSRDAIEAIIGDIVVFFNSSSPSMILATIDFFNFIVWRPICLSHFFCCFKSMQGHKCLSRQFSGNLPAIFVTLTLSSCKILVNV